MHTLFLGGTCNGSTWRDELIPMLDSSKISAFNPVVEHWDEKAQKEEDFHKQNDDIILYTLTPEMKGVYGVFELGMDCCKRKENVMCCILDERNGITFEKHMQKNMLKIKKDLIKNGTPVFDNLESLAYYLNNLEIEKQKQPTL